MGFGREMKRGLAFIGQPLYLLGRDDWIRTSDFCVPNAALYQAEPRPDYYADVIFTKSFEGCPAEESMVQSA